MIQYLFLFMGKWSIYEVAIFYGMLYFSANKFFQTCVYQMSLLLLLIQDIQLEGFYHVSDIESEGFVYHFKLINDIKRNF